MGCLENFNDSVERTFVDESTQLKTALNMHREDLEDTAFSTFR